MLVCGFVAGLVAGLVAPSGVGISHKPALRRAAALSGVVAI